MKLYNPLSLCSLPIAEGATTPVPAGGEVGFVYSTTTNSLMLFVGGTWKAISTTTTSPPPSGPDYRTINIATTIYYAHRGNPNLYGEENDLGYQKGVTDGVKLIDGDCWILSDGVVGVIHDSTVDRTTTGTGNTVSFSSTTFKALNVDVDNFIGLTGAHGNAAKPMTLPDIFAAYKANYSFSFEDKAQNAMTAMIAAADAAGLGATQCMFASFEYAGAVEAAQSKYISQFLDNGTAVPSQIVTDGIDIVCLDAGAATTRIDALLAVGLKVHMYTINRRWIRDQKAALGVTGFYSDDSIYLESPTALRTTDNFALQYWYHGMLNAGSTEGRGTTTRGKFFAPDYFGWDVTTGSYMGNLQGYLSPMANPASYTFEFSVTFDAATSADRWAGIFIQKEDRVFADATADSNSGYHWLVRKNGTIQVYRKNSGVAALYIAGPTNADVIADGTEFRFRLTVSPTSMTMSRLNADGTVNTARSVTTTDVTHRDLPYIILGRNGLACKFRDLVVS